MNARHEKGSAEAATSPSRGSNNPSQENAVNKDDVTTAPGDGASEPIVSVGKLASLEFEPWSLEEPVQQIHTKSEWTEFGAEYLPIARVAHGLMFKTKTELVEIVRDDEEIMMMLIDDMTSMSDSFQAYADLLNAAQARLFVAFAVMCAVPRRNADKSVGTPISGRQIGSDEHGKELADLRMLIEAHRAASIAWGGAVDAIERAALGGGTGPSADLAAFDSRERATLNRLLTWRSSSLDGHAQRLRYLFRDPVGPWKGAVPNHVEVDLLLASMEGASGIASTGECR